MIETCHRSSHSVRLDFRDAFQPSHPLACQTEESEKQTLAHFVFGTSHSLKMTKLLSTCKCQKLILLLILILAGQSDVRADVVISMFHCQCWGSLFSSVVLTQRPRHGSRGYRLVCPLSGLEIRKTITCLHPHTNLFSAFLCHVNGSTGGSSHLGGLVSVVVRGASNGGRSDVLCLHRPRPPPHCFVWPLASPPPWASTSKRTEAEKCP